MRTRAAPSRSRRRNGIISMELVLALPLLMLLLMGMFEFTFLFSARGELVQAARSGARLATLHGVDPVEVENEVRSSLGGRYGSALSVRTQMGEHSGDEVIVTVIVPMTSAAPNLLWPAGYDIQGRDLVAQARMLKE